MPVDQPFIDIQTNRDLLFYTFELEDALELCNSRLEDVREWRQ